MIVVVDPARLPARQVRGVRCGSSTERVRAAVVDGRGGRKLQKITRTAKNAVRMRRAMVVMMSGQGQTVNAREMG